jgi:DNA helicase-2/ATP-dependent DNA helicase PcrA
VKADVRRIFGGTFHSIGNRLLRRHATSLGYGSNFTILDAEDATDLIDLCVDEAAIDTRARRFPKGEVLRDIFSYATNTDTPLEQVIAGKYPHFELLTAPISRVDRPLSGAKAGAERDGLRRSAGELEAAPAREAGDCGHLSGPVPAHPGR